MTRVASNTEVGGGASESLCAGEDLGIAIKLGQVCCASVANV